MSGFIRYFLIFLLILIILFSFVFTSFNTAEVPLWLLRDFSARPLGQWVILAFVTGGLLGLILGYGLFDRIRNRVRVRKLQKQLQAAEQEIAVLRKQPLKEIK
ncbi:MAG: lipopolysaccharide assembly protein LapA domain-containing protein [Pseudohongiellaceae bacterium]